jgi:hypothetical protein
VRETGFAKTATVPTLERHFLHSLEPRTVSNKVLQIGLLTGAVFLCYLPRALGAVLTIRRCIPLFTKRGRDD